MISAKWLPLLIVATVLCTWSLMLDAQQKKPLLQRVREIVYVKQASNEELAPETDEPEPVEPEAVTTTEPTAPGILVPAPVAAGEPIRVASRVPVPVGQLATVVLGDVLAHPDIRIIDAVTKVVIQDNNATVGTVTITRHTDLTIQVTVKDDNTTFPYEFDLKVNDAQIKTYTSSNYRRLQDNVTYELSYDFSRYLNTQKENKIEIVTRRVGGDPVSPYTKEIGKIKFERKALPALIFKSVTVKAGDPMTVDATPLITNTHLIQFQYTIPAEIVAAAEVSDVAVSLVSGNQMISGKTLAKGSHVNEQTFEADLSRFANTGARTWAITYSLANPGTFDSGNAPLSTASKTIAIDTRGPELVDARLLTGNQLELRFREEDLNTDTAIAVANYEYGIAGGNGAALPNAGVVDGNRVRFVLVTLNTGSYQIKVTEKVKDKAGNPAKESVAAFNSFPDRERGTHVEFPEFTKRPPKPADQEFNPGDKVETRVVRLYYFRDAHRVAEIINRNVKSYNRVAVKVTEREAETARENADSATDKRKEQELMAVQQAQELRELERQSLQLEREYAANQADLINQEQQLRQAEGDLAVINKKISEAVTNKDTAAEADARENLRITQNTHDRLQGNVSELKGELTAIQGRLTANTQQTVTARQNEFKARQDVSRQQATEDRARENQFRREVAAATADPDTYAPGKIDSIDKVTQVSVSVIGEGVIQLRGPIRGINTIREMVEQIDSPVGQVKVGIFTVQVNGEHGNRMEPVVRTIEAHIDLSRTLTSQSLMLLRRSVQEVAAQVVDQTDAEFPEGRRQVDRDRRYLYNFFGRDFVDELYEMNSEFLNSENKLLSIHSMDTVSIAQAMFIISLAKNDIREQILDQFRQHVVCELPQAEWDHRRTSKLLPKKFNTLEEVTFNANARYHFRNLHSFLHSDVYSPNTMTPTQREFIRLAQVYKAQLVAEMEYKQRVIERGLIEDQSNSELKLRAVLKAPHQSALQLIGDTYGDAIRQVHSMEADWEDMASLVAKAEAEYIQLSTIASQKIAESQAIKSSTRSDNVTTDVQQKEFENYKLRLYRAVQDHVSTSTVLSESLINRVEQRIIQIDNLFPAESLNSAELDLEVDVVTSEVLEIAQEIKQISAAFDSVKKEYLKFRAELISRDISLDRLTDAYSRLKQHIDDLLAMAIHANVKDPLLKLLHSASKSLVSIQNRESRLISAQNLERQTRGSLDHRKILDFHIDEQAEKVVELSEGVRSHIANFDNYIKRMFMAIEDDVKVQFYDPAFEEIRVASRYKDVTLGQVERTTILGNNRTLMKVSPQATMEFDLPKREIMITEAMGGAKALMTEYGSLMSDPNFLALTKMLSGSPPVGGDAGQPYAPGQYAGGQSSPSVKSVLPGQGSSADEQLFSQVAGSRSQFGTALEQLIPDPAVYKFETGTGFEIRPVIQPDGMSVVYDFDYMYTTNVREPVRADEKHLGRVKRHFLHTQVQTTSFELREVSRYQVALKAARTARGVPLLGDVPGVGVLFRPLPSAESALQQNIILAQSVVYPTLFDLMGLRWSKHVTDMDHEGLRDSEHVIRGRYRSVRDFTFDESSQRFDEFLGIDTKHEKRHLRPDLYRRQVMPSPYHPGGYHQRDLQDQRDPSGREFRVPDSRPPELQDPVYDPKYRRPIDFDEVGPAEILNAPEIGPGEEIPPPEEVDAADEVSQGRGTGPRRAMNPRTSAAIDALLPAAPQRNSQPAGGRHGQRGATIPGRLQRDLVPIQPIGGQVDSASQRRVVPLSTPPEAVQPAPAKSSRRPSLRDLLGRKPAAKTATAGVIFNRTATPATRP